MLFASPRFVRARAQGLLAILGAAVAATVFGCLFGAELIGIPGLVAPIPAVRVFPAIVATAGALVLVEPWHEFELAGIWSVQRHRSYRFALGSVVVGGAGGALSANAGSRMILVLSALLFCAIAVLIGWIGKNWWVVIALALYGQLFVQDYEQFQPGFDWVIMAVGVALPCYLFRGESVIGRTPT